MRQHHSIPIFHPCAVAKLYAYWICVNYRQAYGIYASNGILFNHDPMRGETFVTRKIAKAVAKSETGQQEKIYLGNLNAQRDWGHAKEYVEGMWKILQHSDGDDLFWLQVELKQFKSICGTCFWWGLIGRLFGRVKA